MSKPKTGEQGFGQARRRHRAHRGRGFGGADAREARFARVRKEGIAPRRVVYHALHSALGDGPMAELDELVGTAEDPASLARGLESLAALVERRLAKGSDDERASLEEHKVGAARAKALREKAAQVRESGEVAAAGERKVSQRALDLHDGRVLLLVGKVLRAFRAAHKADATIVVPHLSRLAWLFDSRSRKAPAPAPVQPKEPVPA